MASEPLDRHPLAGRGDARRPAATNASASAASSEAVTCEPWAPVGVARSVPSLAVEPDAQRLRAPAPRHVRGQRARARAAAAASAPCSARSAGRANSTNVTKLETGLPGRPKTSWRAARPEPRRLARLQVDAPEALLDAERRERRLDVVVRPDRHAAGERRRRRASSSAAASAASVACARRRATAARARHRRRPRARASAASVGGVRVVDLAGRRAPRPAGAARRRCRGSPRAGGARTRACAAPAPTATPSSPAPSTRPGAQHDAAGAQVLAGAAHVLAGARPPRSSVTRRRRASRTCSTGATASAPAGIARAGRDADRLAGPSALDAGAPARDSPTTRSGAAGRVAANGEAVHGRIVERRHVRDRGHVVREHATGRIPTGTGSAGSGAQLDATIARAELDRAAGRSGTRPFCPSAACRCRDGAGIDSDDDGSDRAAPHARAGPMPVERAEAELLAGRAQAIAKGWLLTLLERAPLDARRGDPRRRARRPRGPPSAPPSRVRSAPTRELDRLRPAGDLAAARAAHPARSPARTTPPRRSPPSTRCAPASGPRALDARGTAHRRPRRARRAARGGRARASAPTGARGRPKPRASRGTEPRRPDVRRPRPRRPRARRRAGGAR